MTTFAIAISDDLEIGLFASGDADPISAAADLERVLKALEMTDGIEVSGIGEIENHRDQDRLARVHDLTHQ